MWLVDFARNSQSNPARTGSGPLEFNTSGMFLPGASDTATFYDVLQRRFLLFSPEGAPVRTVSYGGTDLMAMLSLPQPSAVDAAGRAYGQSMGMRMPNMTGGGGFTGPTFDDSVTVARFDLRSGKSDTIARVRSVMAQSQPNMELTGGTMKMTVTAPDFRANDVWAAMPDGRVAILRDGDYRVRFVAPGAATVLGPPVPHTLIPLTRAMQEAAMDSIRRAMTTARQATGRAMDEARAAAGASGGAAAALPNIEFNVKEPAAWAPNLPPYTGIMSSPSGKLWVSVPTSVGDNSSHHDVLDGRGVLLARVRRAPGETLVGIGRGFVYTIRKDADDLQYLRRYALPTTIK
jgi:hypothetical protein